MGGTPIFHRLPIVIWALVALILGIEAVFQAGAHGLVGGPGAIGWRLEATARVGFSDPLFDYMVEVGVLRWDGVARLFSYPFIHGGGLHAALGAVLLLALGKAVGERFSVPALVGFLVAGSVGGALLWGGFIESEAALVGIYPGVYGLIGAFTWSLFMARRGRQRITAFRLVTVLIVLQILKQTVFGGYGLWVADLGGFAAGFGAAYVLAPDGGDRLRRWRERLRER